MSKTNDYYQAFISYSHNDAKWAEWLHQSLERYVVPIDVYPSGEGPETEEPKRLRKLTPVFRDRDELSVSGSLAVTICDALEASENLIVLCSKSSAASHYVNAEIDIFRNLHPDNEQKIFALIIDGSPPDCFPPALTEGGIEPIAADARENGDGKADAKLKLIAGLLGVGFDRLKQREVKRQRNRLLTMVTVVSVVAVMTSVLALWALKAENKAVQQTTRAEEQRGLAEQQRELAEQQRGLAEEQRARAEQSAEESKAVLNFFETKVLAAARPKKQVGGLGIDVTIRAAVDAAVPKIDADFADKPLIEASIRATLGETYRYLGAGNAAIAQNERTLELRKKFLEPDNPEILLSMRGLANSYSLAGRFEEALKLREEAVLLSREVLGDENPNTLGSMNELATSYQKANRHQEALALLKKTLEVQQKLEHPDALYTMSNMATSFGAIGRHKESLELNKKTLLMLKDLKGIKHPDTLGSMNNLAISYQQAGRHAEALSLHEETLKWTIEIKGAKHQDTLKSMSNLSHSYSDVERHEEALTLREKTLTLRIEELGIEHPDTLASINELADSYVIAGRHEEEVSLRKKYQGNDHPDTLNSIISLAGFYGKSGKHVEAIVLRKEALVLTRKQKGDNHPDILSVMEKLAIAYLQAKQQENAEKQYRELITLRKEHAPNDLSLFFEQTLLGTLLFQRKQYDESELLLLAGYEGLKLNVEKDKIKYLKNSIRFLTELYKNWGKPDKAAEWQAKLDALDGDTQ